MTLRLQIWAANRARSCLAAAGITALSSAIPIQADACTRVLYETGSGNYLTGRNMDWSDMKAQMDLWVFPSGMQRNGGVGKGSTTWTSKYGSVIISIYDSVTSDGVNEAGLAGNMLYLAESDFGNAKNRGKPLISVGAWLQYMLDNYATVAEAVKAMHSDPLTVIPATAPNGAPALAHLSLSDPSGDSAILEFIDGKLNIHHGRQYQVMTNSPVYDQQLAINSYWNLIGGEHFLPGTISAPDRYVRASYALKTSPKFKDKRDAVASIFSQMRWVSTPLGMSDPNKPNIAPTLWRSVTDHESKRYYFDSVINPVVLWVDLDKLDLSQSGKVLTLNLNAPNDAGGEISGKLKPAVPFTFIAP
ncbi:linear amide C-N hydrolase [Microbulbifer thermotolerans]|uniref:Linear amide C-N hydrolase n=1 Tax=Microbulbifer thermotolerans TaxID=252514 RepID=A0AB35HY53_MICTH|nr:linear amide C-N hydrolase [Microbulbifer thermotolerans]MCX2802199.1 linear amide C-N hydrolase [Microbulbifer thermotolerans]